MKNLENTAGKEIVAFQIGRGGKFNNAGHTTFNGVSKIGNFTNNLFLKYENEGEIYKLLYNRNLDNLRTKLEECVDNENVSFFEKLGLKLGNKIYFDHNGNEVGLTENECESGIGKIDIDGIYDTVYTQLLENCEDWELQQILDHSGWINQQILDYCNEKLCNK